MRKLSLLIITATVATVLSISTYANLLLNPGFTDNGTYGQLPTTNMTYWTTWGASGYYQDDINSDASVKFWFDDTGAYQNYSANANEVYDYSIYAQTRSSDQLQGWKGYLKAEFYDNDWNQLNSYVVDTFTTNDAVDAWVQLSGLATSPVGTVYGRITIGIEHDVGGTAGSIYYDDADVHVAVPEPASAALLIGGIAGIICMRRRMKK